MSRPLIPNSCPVPNVLLDVVIPRLKPAAVRVLLLIVRFTYGFQRESDRISLTQLQKATGLSRQGVSEGIYGTATKAGSITGEFPGLLIITPGAKGRAANEYRLNIDITTGQLVNKLDQSEKLTSQVGSQNFRLSQRHSKSKERDGNKPQFPDSRKKGWDPTPFQPVIKKVVACLNDLAGKSYNPDSKDISSYLLACLRSGATEADCLLVVEDRCRRWKDNPEMVEHLNPVTLFRPTRFQVYLTEAKAAGNGRGPVIKDLGNDRVEIDGRQMSKETYRQRYGSEPQPTNT